ncbi:MAG: transposase [Bacilli bacterium]
MEEYCSDMSAAFISGMAEAFPKAKQTVDKFHVMKLHGTIDVATRAVINLSLRPQCLYE